jgi:hypothetical protein
MSALESHHNAFAETIVQRLGDGSMSGSFEFRRVVSGSGTIVAVARRASGERCTARAAI